jgi:hypothetical protein
MKIKSNLTIFSKNSNRKKKDWHILQNTQLIKIYKFDLKHGRD